MQPEFKLSGQEIELARPWQLFRSRPIPYHTSLKGSLKAQSTLHDVKLVGEHYSSNQSLLIMVTVNTAYYRKRRIPSWICTLIDALTPGRPVHMHASDFDVEKAIVSREETTPCKSGPAWIFLPFLCWCILLVFYAIRFLMYYYSLPTSLHTI
jgi:hypothetical protein